MINLAELDINRMNHEAQIAHNNRYGWMDDLATGAPEAGTGQADDVMSRLRRTIGNALVSGGKWLEGTPAANSATVGSCVESIR